MKKIILFFSFFFCFSNANAQPPAKVYSDYGSQHNEMIRESEKSREAKADLTRKPNASSSSSSSGSTTVEKDPEIERLWRMAKGDNRTDAQIAEEEKRKKTSNDEYLARTKAEDEARDKRWEEESRQAKMFNPQFENLLMQSGLESYQARMFTDRIKSEYKNDKVKMFNHINKTTTTLKYLQENSNTSSFEDFSQNISIIIKDCEMSFSTFKFITVMETRFPDKMKEIDELRINAFISYFKWDGEFLYTGRPFYEGERKTIVDSYFALEDKDPKVYSKIQNFLGYKEGPYETVDKYYTFFQIQKKDGDYKLPSKYKKLVDELWTRHRIVLSKQ
jgi:hypothetical protein